jgi:hypothetical protein
MEGVKMSGEKGLIEERLEAMWARSQKLMEEGTVDEHWPELLEHFSREVFPLVAVRALLKGVGKLDKKTADIVWKELGHACGEFELGLMALKGVKVPATTDKEIDALVKAHEEGENVASGGRSKVSREGNTATLVEYDGLVPELCPLVKVLKIDATTDFIWPCTRHHLKHVYETVLNRPVEVELTDPYTIKMSW